MNLLKDRAFAAAVIVLALACAGMFAAPLLGIALTKLAVPWPKGAEVDSEYRNTSLSKVAGPYARVEEDGILFRDRSGKAIKDGLPDGEFIYAKDDLNTLGIGSNVDKELITQRASNWYLSRIYRDTREGPSSNYQYWRLDITYYTGGLDTVPHIGENCLVAGGALIENAGDSLAVDIPGLPAPWKEWNKLVFRRVVYNTGKDRRMQYYIFSLNGESERSNLRVRGKLANPFQKYVYFAKIQFEPCSPIERDEETDRRTQDFIRSCLPLVLKDLPTVEDVRKLESVKTGR